MGLNWLAPPQTWHGAVYFWQLLALVWFVMFLGMKKAKRLEGWGERAQHELLVLVAFWLLLANYWNGGWLGHRLVPDVPEVRMPGLALTAVGVGTAIWARLSLGSNWSGMVTLKQDHQLVTTGLYRWIRHPIYTGILLAMVGTALIGGQVRGCLATALALAAFYFKSRREERFLHEEFGSSYEDHARRTGMFLPKLTSWKNTP
jgi:protein-S-isoprenylcysteine O-methyltransferase Ste14